MPIPQSKTEFRLNGLDKKRLKHLKERYMALRLDYKNCHPLIIIELPEKGLPSWREQFENPEAMVGASLKRVQAHLNIQDDYYPIVRVEFGTAQVASTFGVPIRILEDSQAAAGQPILSSAEDVENLRIPDLTSGIYKRLTSYTNFFKENLPEGVVIQHPDIQSTFNTAQLIRGNGIFTDFYDSPESVEMLLDKVTDYMIRLVPYLKGVIDGEEGWFFDWGCYWEGSARLSNCSMQMLSPELYRRYIFPRDVRFLTAVNKGRIHYCGLNKDVIFDFFKIPALTGLDFDAGVHDLWEVADSAPPELVLMAQFSLNSNERHNPETKRRLLKGDFPKKRNIIYLAYADNIDDAKAFINCVRNAYL